MKVNKIRGGGIKMADSCAICLENFSWPEEGEWVEKFGLKPDDFNSNKVNSNTPIKEILTLDTICILPCSHIFHYKCINDNYKSSENNCPICKGPFTNTSIKTARNYIAYDKNYFLKMFKDLNILNISEFLQQNSLIINYNILKSIVEALKDNKTIKILDMSNNRIGDAGAIVLAEALKVNKTLTTVILRYCGIHNDGATALAEALKVNKILTTLDIRNNRTFMRYGIKQTIEKLLTRNKNLTKFEELNNNIVNIEVPKDLHTINNNEKRKIMSQASIKTLGSRFMSMFR